MTYHENKRATREQIVEFTTICHDVWATSYEKHMEGRVAPAFQDKPLTNLEVEFTKRNVYNNTTLTPEHLDIAPLSPDDTAQMRVHKATHDLPDYIHDYYHGVAVHLGSVALTNDTRFREAVPPNGIVGSYIGSSSNEATRVVDSFRVLPDQRSVKFAISMAKSALGYIQSGEFELPVTEKLIRAVQNRSGDILQHRFTIKMTPDLPLNGREGERFIAQYRDRMFALLRQRQEDLTLIMMLGASESQVQAISEEVAKYSRAFKRAQDILKED